MGVRERRPRGAARLADHLVVAPNSDERVAICARSGAIILSAAGRLAREKRIPCRSVIQRQQAPSSPVPSGLLIEPGRRGGKHRIAPRYLQPCGSDGCDGGCRSAGNGRAHDPHRRRRGTRGCSGALVAQVVGALAVAHGPHRVDGRSRGAHASGRTSNLAATRAARPMLRERSPGLTLIGSSVASIRCRWNAAPLVSHSTTSSS
jgi:hypothetical protein